MNHFLVTVKLPKNPLHNPHNKVKGFCPVNGMVCTDVTGEHHTTLVSTKQTLDEVMDQWKRLYHVTRIEAM